MTYNEEYAKQGLSPMCLEPLRYGRMSMNKKLGQELNEPFKADLRNPKWSPCEYHAHVEAKDPILFLEICANIIKVLKERGCAPEVLFGDLPTMQKTIDEGAEPEKDA